MPAARGVKRTASKSSASTSSSTLKNKKKRVAIQWEIPTALKTKGRVYTCGQGDVGQLGLGEDVEETSKFKQVTVLGDKIVQVYAGGMHTIALDSTGKVWTFGCNDEGALGRATSGEKDEATPKRITLPSKAVSIAAGDSHSAALLDTGDVYAWGSFRDSHGSMGLVVRGREGKPCRDPVRVDIGETSVGIASGGDHLVILSTSGSVYTMGCGEQGQLGRLSQRSASRDARQGFSALLVPSKVTLKGGASRIFAGYHATFAIDANNDKLFAWGLNNYGQLGITGEKRKTALFAPTECDAFASAGGNWKHVAAGQHHSLAMDDAGQVYAIGRCEYGRLGLGDREGDAEALEPIVKLQTKKCVSIAASTSSSFAVTDTGEVYAWGMGSEGQLGTGTAADEKEPVLAERAGLLVSAGGQHTVLLVKDPSGPKADSPEPEEETAEQEPEVEEEKETDEKPKSRPTKRQKKQEQEDEVSSTSSAQPSEVAEEAKPQKVNGDEKKETPMEVDETDNAPEKQEETKPEEQSQESEPEQSQETQQVPEPELKPETVPAPEPETKEDAKTETDTSSQETDSDAKSQDTEEDKLNDVEMKDEKEINGTPETAEVETKEAKEAKTLEFIQPSNPLTTTA